MSPEARREILEMVASGKISADDASTLLQGDEAARSVESPPAEQAIPIEEESVDPIKGAAIQPSGEAAAPSKARRGRSLHIHVSDLKSGNRRVSVNVPLGFVRAGLALGQRVAPELRGFTWDDIASALADEQDGMIIDVKDERDGEHVQIFVD